MHVIENELTIDRGVTLSSWGGQAARVSVMSLGKGRRAGWVAQITGLDIAHTFSRVFCRASVDQRDRAGRGLLVFELPDGRYEANAPRIGRVCFHVEEGVITRSDVPEMLALVRADAGVSYGDVRAMVSERKLSSARQLAMYLVHPGERESAYQLALGAALEHKVRSLPVLQGRAEEVEWAQDLRATAFNAMLDGIEPGRAVPEAELEQLLTLLSSQRKCSWWIRHRHKMRKWEDLHKHFIEMKKPRSERRNQRAKTY